MQGLHEFRPENEAKGLAKATPWGWRGTCVCGARQPGLAGTQKQALRWYLLHRGAH